MARVKHWDEESQSYKYSDDGIGGGGGGSSGAVRTVLWSGAATNGTTITLSDDAANYDLIQIVVTVGGRIIGAPLNGAYVREDYYGGGINASGMVWGSGGFPYLFHVEVDETGTLHIPPAIYYSSSPGSSSGTASGDTVTITEIIGYKLG